MHTKFSCIKDWASVPSDPERRVTQSWNPLIDPEVLIYSPYPEGDYLVASYVMEPTDAKPYIKQILTGGDWEPLMRYVAGQLKLKLESECRCLVVCHCPCPCPCPCQLSCHCSASQKTYYLIDENFNQNGDGNSPLIFGKVNNWEIKSWRVDVNRESQEFVDSLTWVNTNKDKNIKSEDTTHSWRLYDER